MRTKLLWDFLRDYRYVGAFERAGDVLIEHVARFRGDVDVLACTDPLLLPTVDRAAPQGVVVGRKPPAGSMS
jgi:hypothetical protein